VFWILPLDPRYSINRFDRRSSGCPKGHDIQDNPDDEYDGAGEGAGDAIIAIHDASPVEYREEEAEEQWRHHEESADDSYSKGDERPHAEYGYNAGEALMGASPLILRVK